MTRREFSMALRGALVGLGEAEIEKSVQFYDELIADHMDEGMGEEEAAQAVGDVDAIAREVLLDQPVAKLVRRRVRNFTWLKGFAAVALVLGLPVWLPLLLVFVLLIVLALLLAYGLLFVVNAGLWTAVAAVVAIALAATLSITFTSGGLVYAGVALAAAGIAILFGYGVVWATRLCVYAWRGMARGVRRVAMGRGKRDAHRNEG